MKVITAQKLANALHAIGQQLQSAQHGKAEKTITETLERIREANIALIVEQQEAEFAERFALVNPVTPCSKF